MCEALNMLTVGTLGQSCMHIENVRDADEVMFLLLCCNVHPAQLHFGISL